MYHGNQKYIKLNLHKFFDYGYTASFTGYFKTSGTPLMYYLLVYPHILVFEQGKDVISMYDVSFIYSEF